ncbi:MAG: 3-isopropylmalate dehydratase large subunit [Candidatus Rokubacteria bacterium]|nr:3-isopropylmalate dehydratase large subunit [Candidatus Rokubacteria bacterium]MBI4629371.1 3-isopropylmalate dehydratase large subunit [Candidatus Rokubacteria bacterium]
MGMTITEKIIAVHAGRAAVEPGEFVTVRVDLAMGNDLSTAGAIGVLRQMEARRVFDPDKVVIVFDHVVPAKDIAAATMLTAVRAWVREQGLPHVYDEGRQGIAHVVLPEQGLVLPGDLVIGGDSHTCTYGAVGAFSAGVGHTDLAGVLALGETWLKVPASQRFVYHGAPGRFVMGKDLILATLGRITIDGARYEAMEFVGPAIERLGMSDRLTMCNMAIEAGAKSGIIAPDDVTLEYVRPRARRAFTPYRSDPDARYAAEHAFDVGRLRPMVAKPFSPDNVVPVDEVAGTRLDQVFIGSCTNAKLEDLRVAAAILKGRKAHPYTRLIVIPASTWIWQQALREGLLEIFSEAGAAVSTPTCGACFGGHMGILGRNEVCLSTSNRNFVGRMGDPTAQSYLANPAVAAASAIKGAIAAPDEVL